VIDCQFVILLGRRIYLEISLALLVRMINWQM